MGIVVDEYGDIQGLVTVEDILEEIVGDFTTSMSPTLAEEVTPQSDGSVLIDGTANVRELNKAFNWNLPAIEARTINGLLLEELGRSRKAAPASASATMILIFWTCRTI
ncbi:hypothetical protein GGER_08820 [Serratia rubidaea]